MVSLLPRGLLELGEALLTPHGADRYLELLDPMLVRREIRGRVTQVRHQTPDTVTFRVRPSRAWRGFEAGQYVRLTVEIDGVRRTRCYSPCGLDGGDLEFTVKAAPQGLVSRYLKETTRIGSVFGLSAADGEFTLPSPRPERIVLVSGGSGITPVLAMARRLVAERHDGEVVFLHYSNTTADTLYRGELAALARQHLGFRVVHAHTDAAGTPAVEPSGDLHGYFSRDHLEHAAPWFRDAETYLCGPQPLMAAVSEVFAAEGLSERLHTEEFAAPPLTFDPAAAAGTVRFARSGIDRANSGEPLLEQAEAAGLAPEHGCRMGICFSCTQVKTAGRVRNARTGEVSGEGDEEIQLCINVPVGDVEIDV
ncbi:MAG TPA: ferredoxin reductase [Amycolatopsis sp.]|jgi:ferredoxin-NADP reductase|nr:ferredoxin reductase [Amycolatopsis sp.]